ncbi:type I phosphodiesterase/nucleotide pyrophosphatase [Janibacter hoylei PVAS-1]|uniref:Alkaline phosphatase family protein n=1 Tax=Janibacter hoylei PVAS-1 TaxID=1210046 RepID=K1ES88_9MICO|nr:nucleotide pyrophosphatase/phosphodiesterase family protein [Janibacter hoylei]EKA62068.1 type I phosphodiesterase/nucleotide pyrophosphatase [Janibacter hoylei PVAS-1]RWU83755.1 alkaline phosphatase family protein [Janibacter hoylei PVAS-1]
MTHHHSPLLPATPRLDRVLPAVATSLGVPGLTKGGDRPLRPARRAVVVLVDGLGAQLLARRGGHAPFLRQLLQDADAARTIDCGFPSTTATSMGTFGTGTLAGAHGLVGYEAYDPDTDSVFNELSWEDGPAPRRWQPAPTVFEAAVEAGVGVTRIGPGFFDGSGLTEAALRGGSFVAASSLAQRVDATLRAVRAQPRGLVYLYWGDIDKVGHVHGCDSHEWVAELESVDAELARLASSLPRDTALHITADHGMVDVPLEARPDIATDAHLDAGVRHVSGEPRCVQLHVRPGARDDVVDTWRARLGEDALVVTTEEAIEAGWFGTVSASVRPRIGDVIAAMTGPVAVVDSRRHRPELRSLLGVHGSITPDEVAVPWLVLSPQEQ